MPFSFAGEAGCRRKRQARLHNLFRYSSLGFLRKQRIVFDKGNKRLGTAGGVFSLPPDQADLLFNPGHNGDAHQIRMILQQRSIQQCGCSQRNVHTDYYDTGTESGSHPQNVHSTLLPAVSALSPSQTTGQAHSADTHWPAPTKSIRPSVFPDRCPSAPIPSMIPAIRNRLI